MPENTIISATDADWSREKAERFWHPSAKLLRSMRRYQKYKANRRLWAYAICTLEVIKYRFWSIVCACDIPINCDVEGGLILTHPNGVVIHPKAKIGPNCLILQQVTLVAGVTLAGHVDIGAGAKIIKPVTIGAHAKVGANAVVIDNVPDYATAVGAPARIVEKKEITTSCT